MAKRVQDKKPRRNKAAQAWLDKSVKEQRARHKVIAQEMEALEPTRRKWYEEFLNIVQTKGFNVTGDTRRKIGKDELPKKPRRKDQVVY